MRGPTDSGVNNKVRIESRIFRPSIRNNIPAGITKHKTHKSGLEVDVRPLRKDGGQSQVYWYQEEYDRDGTAKLIALFQAYPGVRQILFNDKEIPFVKAFKNHDHHFHVAL